MPTLEVPGARSYYEVVGQGPMLLAIHGGDGSGEIWRALSERLNDRFKVVFYDRRGFSQSYLTGAQDYAQRLETDADDAARLIAHLSPQSPAIIIGNSSGAIVSLRLLSRYPELVSTVLPYKPSAAQLLPDFNVAHAAAEEVYATYRAAGIVAGYKKFAESIRADDNMRRMITQVPTDNLVRNWNSMYWFEREFMSYPYTEFDIDVELKPHKDKPVLVNGKESDKEPYKVRANVVLAGRLGLEVVLCPGGHVGHATCAEDFVARLVEILTERGQ